MIFIIAAGSDYVSTPGVFIFTPNVSEFTVNIPILDNQIREDEEYFNATLSTTDPAVVFGISTSEVIIADDDGLF